MNVISPAHIVSNVIGDARVSTTTQTFEQQAAALTAAGAGKRPGGSGIPFPARGYLTLGEVRWVFDPAVQTVRAAITAQRQQEIEKTGHAQTPDFPVLTPHQLRHTCASLAISAGANVKVLQALLGHKTATLTLDRYGHLFSDDLGRIADAFDTAAETAADALRTTPVLSVIKSQ